ncbi:hypothetical protein EDC04DRAFT_2687994 [Pisolithus marmoratus]|nr:hypothetical protein EDC04DRAFT_2687994 [Pisolithus marmoratus]
MFFPRVILDFEQESPTTDGDLPCCPSVPRNPHMNWLLRINSSLSVGVGRPGSYFPGLPPSRTLPILMHEMMTWSVILAYFRTWNALHAFRKMHLEDAKNPEGPAEVRAWTISKRGASNEC